MGKGMSQKKGEQFPQLTQQRDSVFSHMSAVSFN